MANINLGGTGIALVTPFDADKKIDFKALKRIIDHVITGGVDYVVTLGTTGESATLDREEKASLIAATVDIVDNRVPVIAGFGGNNTAAITQDLKSADLSGVSGILSVSPYYNKPSQEGLYYHYMEIADSSPLPVIIYNVPGRTASNISADTTLKLASNHPNLVAVKEASGNMEQCMKIVKNNPRKDFCLLSGDDAFTLQMISFGFQGVISVIGNSHPKQFSGMVNHALNGDFAEARKLHYNLLPIIELLFQEGSPGGIKALLAHMGICEENVRLPLWPVSQELRQQLLAFSKPS